MTIDEAIKHCEEVAEKYCEKVEEGLTADDFCDSCASEHRQLAEWLRELKRDREVLTELDTAIEYYENCECCQGFREYPTSRFIEDVIRINKEANADEEESESE